MAKKSFVNPFLLLLDVDPGEDSGGASGAGTINPIRFEDWLEMYQYDDFDGVGDPGTFDDYRAWWIQNDLSLEAWKGFNGNEPLNP